MADHSNPETSHSNQLLSIIGGLGSIMVFLFILFVAYLPNRPAPVDQEAIEERKERLAELHAQQRETVSSYGWVNRDEGKVRIPVDRAMHLTVEKLQQDIRD